MQETKALQAFSSSNLTYHWMKKSKMTRDAKHLCLEDRLSNPSLTQLLVRKNLFQVLGKIQNLSTRMGVMMLKKVP